MTYLTSKTIWVEIFLHWHYSDNFIWALDPYKTHRVLTENVLQNIFVMAEEMRGKKQSEIT